jgi:hypothetical protein
MSALALYAECAAMEQDGEVVPVPVDDELMGDYTNECYYVMQHSPYTQQQAKFNFLRFLRIVQSALCKCMCASNNTLCCVPCL